MTPNPETQSLALATTRHIAAIWLALVESGAVPEEIARDTIARVQAAPGMQTGEQTLAVVIGKAALSVLDRR